MLKQGHQYNDQVTKQEQSKLKILITKLLNQGFVIFWQILPDDDRWEFPRHQLKILSKLGEGSFGQVWKCEAENIDGNKGSGLENSKAAPSHSWQT